MRSQYFELIGGKVKLIDGTKNLKDLQICQLLKRLGGRVHKLSQNLSRHLKRRLTEHGLMMTLVYVLFLVGDIPLQIPGGWRRKPRRKSDHLALEPSKQQKFQDQSSSRQGEPKKNVSSGGSS